jgi:hypothetical protein
MRAIAEVLVAALVLGAALFFLIRPASGACLMWACADNPPCLNDAGCLGDCQCVQGECR